MKRGRNLRFLLVAALSGLAAGCVTDPYAPVYDYGAYSGYGGYSYYDSAWGPYYGPLFWPDYSYYPVCSPFCGGFYSYSGSYYPGHPYGPGWSGPGWSGPGWRRPPWHGGPGPIRPGGRPGMRGSMAMHNHSFAHSGRR